MSDDCLARIARLLDAVLDPAQRKRSEKALREEANKPKYSLALLKVVASDSHPLNTRLSAALSFKNFIRTTYVDEEGNYRLPEDEVVTIKQQLVGLMIASPPKIQVQLGEAISIIADSDFYTRWQTLTQDLVSRLSDIDHKVTNGVLEVAHSIFVRWRPLFPSNGLYEEINHVAGTFGPPFVGLLAVADRNIESSTKDAEAVKGWLNTLGLLIRLFQDLTCQDVPPVILDNLAHIMSIFRKYMEYSNAVLSENEDEPTVIEIVKSDICEALQFWTTKFDEDFEPYRQEFANVVWNVLSSTGQQRKYDILVSRALQFLTAVASAPVHVNIFNNEEVLATLIEKVILPNVTLRKSDEEMLEDEPIEYIRRDLEGSDTDSRRRAATEFLRKLLSHFQELVTKTVFKYINHYLESGKSDWRHKDTAVYLFLAIAAIGSVTAAQGVITVNPYVNVLNFFEQHIAADLIADTGVHPISKVNAIKYLHNFRSQLDKSKWQTALQPLIKNMASDNYVVYTYAAIAVERVLYLQIMQGKHMFEREDIEPFAEQLLNHLFALIEKDPSPAKLQENEFLMRCIMRVLLVLKMGVIPIMVGILDHLINITNIIKANPSNPRFYYYHFEALGALSRYCGPDQVDKFVTKLWEPFYYVLSEDVSEFVPFVFQIYSFVLDMNPSMAVPDKFSNLIQVVLSPTAWELRGNVPALARFSAAVVPRVSDAILKEGKLEAFLTRFQMLLSNKKTDQSAFDILEAITVAFPGSVLDQYFGVIVRLLFEKLQSNPSDAYKTRVVRYYHLVSARSLEPGLGADFFCKHAEAIQQNVFVQFYLGVVLEVTRNLARPVDRKLAVVSYTKTLCESQAFGQKYAKGWGYTCNNLLDLLKSTPSVGAGGGDEIINEADVDDIGFGVGFTALSTCKKGARDDFPEIGDVQKWVSTYMKEMNLKTCGQIRQFVETRLNGPAKEVMSQILA